VSLTGAVPGGQAGGHAPPPQRASKIGKIGKLIGSTEPTSSRSQLQLGAQGAKPTRWLGATRSTIEGEPTAKTNA